METVRAALVTGGSSGIGQGIAIVLAEHGYDIAITYGKNAEGGEKTKKQIEALGRRCFLYQASLERPEVPAQIVDQAHRDLGRLDVLVNNAGRDSRNSVLTATAEDIHYIMDVNFRGYCLAAGAAARHFVRDKIPGNIVFITSSRGDRAYPEDFLYGGIKAAIKRACESMALDLAPYGIRGNCVAPGATQGRDSWPKPKVKPGKEERKFYPLEDMIPLKRMGTPRDNGELIAFLVSDKASYITGVSIRVDGGLILPGPPEGWGPAVWYNEEWGKKHYDAVMNGEV